MGIVGRETLVGPKISYQMNAESLTGGADTIMLRTQNELHCPNLSAFATWNFLDRPFLFVICGCVVVWLCGCVEVLFQTRILVMRLFGGQLGPPNV